MKGTGEGGTPKPARVVGTVVLTEAHIGSVEIMGAHITPLKRRGELSNSLHRAVSARGLIVQSGFNVSGLQFPDKQFLPTLFEGQLALASAKITGAFRAGGAQIECGFNEQEDKGDSHDARDAQRAIAARHLEINGEALLGRLQNESELKEKGLARELLRTLGLSGERSPDKYDDVASSHVALGDLATIGELDLRDLRISGDLRFNGFSARGLRRHGPAVTLRSAKVSGTLEFSNPREDSKGRIDLREVQAGLYRDDFECASSQAFHKAVGDWTAQPLRILMRCALVAVVATFALLLFGAFEEFAALLIHPQAFLLLATFPLHALGAAVLGAYLLLTAYSFLTLPPRDYRPGKPPAGHWPSKLKFVLIGFRYGAFVVREIRVSDAASDTAVMRLDGGARIRWLKHQPRDWVTSEFQPQPWVQCAAVLREMGNEAESHRVLFRRELYALRSKSMSWQSRLIRGALIFLCGHGHAMQLLVFWGASAFLFGWAVHDVAFRANLVRPTNSVILVDGRYAVDGAVPTDYSSFRPVPYTFGRMLPLPPMAGRGEWAPCNGPHIREAILSQFGPNPHRGGCVPSSCELDRRGRRESGACGVLAMKVDIDCLSSGAHTNAECIDLDAPPNLGAADEDIVSRVGWLDARTRGPAMKPLRDRINEVFLNGAAAPASLAVGVVGWLISIILTTYAVGLLKRRE